MAGTFVGRARELAAIDDAIAVGELVTVTGPGGVGKTQTALRAAAAAAQRLGVETGLVELVAVADTAGVTEALDRVLASAARPLVLLVDNAEHVLDAVTTWARTVDRDQVAVVVTSRAPLGVRDERIVVLPVLATDDAVALFRDRAAQIGASVDDDAALATLCARLDHLPLAIELAAARSRVLSPASITARLDDRFAVLPHHPDPEPAHHRSLDAAIAWSHDLLSADEQHAFGRLAVFGDRFDLNQAEHVGVGLDTLDALVTQSLVAAEPAAIAPYRLLESVRAFAHAQPGDDDTAALDGLVVWLAEFTAPIDDGHMTGRIFEYLDVVAVDVRRAVQHAIREAPSVALHLLGRIGAWFWERGRVAEGIALTQAALATDAETDALASARVLNALANLHVRSGDPAAAVPSYERALALRIAHGAADAQLASNRNDFGTCLLHLGELPEARDQLERAHALYDAIGDRWGVATTLTNLAALAVTAGNAEGAAEQFGRVAEEFTALGDHAQAAAARTNEGLVLLEADDARAGDVLAAAVRAVLRAGVRSILPHALAGAATAALDGGNGVRAARLWGAAKGNGFAEGADDLERRIGDSVGWDALDGLLATGTAADDAQILAWLDDAEPAPSVESRLTRTDRDWTVAFAGTEAHLPNVKGVEYLARLLVEPGVDVHVADLAGVQVVQRGSEATDEAALAAYRRRVTELQAALDDADARGDADAGIAAQAELDHLTAEIKRSTGRGGKPRREGDDAERARKSVTNRIRDAIRFAADVHPELGRHLDHAVVTGTFCRYEPEHPTTWTVLT